MLDIINLPEFTTIECSLNDLPLPIIEKINPFLNQDEGPHLCIVHTDSLVGEKIREFRVYVISPLCVIYLVNEAKDGKYVFDTPTHGHEGCIFLSEITGVQRREWSKGGKVKLVSPSGVMDVEFIFRDLKLLRKFETFLISLKRSGYHVK